MNISNIHIMLCNEQNSNLKALASFVVDNTIVVHDVKILGYTKEKILSYPEPMHDLLSNPCIDNCHMFVSMPSRKTANGAYSNIVNPYNAEANEYITIEILNAYIDALREAQQ